MQHTVHSGEILLGKYRVERVLGQGGMGVVVAARHVHLGELFAIKMLLPSGLSHPDAVERFLREARAAAKLKGEHVARVHDVGILEDGAPYMVMEHLAGNDLKQIVKSRGGLPLEEAALYVYQACEAVAEAHANGVVHRDLKPANLFLIRRPNGTPCVKVLDFGISKELDPNNTVGSDLTKTGAFMGSPLYMSPEQMANIKATDMRSDIWGLGVILYELTTGKLPFTAQAVTELVTKVLATEPLPPSQVRPDIPQAFDAIVLKCLEKRPEHRFQSVHELMGQLLPYASASAPQVLAAAALPMAPPRPEMASMPTTVVLAAAPDVETNPSISESNSGGASNPAGLIVAPTHSSLTGGAWGTTNKATERRKDKLMLALAVAGLGLAALLGVAFIATRSSTPASASKAEPIKIPTSTVAPMGTASQATPAPNNEPDPAPTASAQESPPQAIAEPTTVPTAEPTAPKTEPTAPTAQEHEPSQSKPAKAAGPSKPASTSSRKSSVADFND
ncbi:MAG: protein kinase [Polyangiaceae bacterium]|nr:protein kinase [Polyangiaceae bacterium]